VAPVIREENRREIYLPRGKWCDYWSGEVIEGPVTIPADEEIPLDVLPLFVKPGSVIPMRVENDVTGHGGEFSKGAITLDVYPADTGTLRDGFASGGGVRTMTWLVPDMSITVTVEVGGLLRRPATDTTATRYFEVSFPPVPQPVVLRILSPEPAGVLDGGSELSQGREEGSWFYDEETGRAYAILGPGKEHKVRVVLSQE
jgi:hypothetical protein